MERNEAAPEVTPKVLRDLAYALALVSRPFGKYGKKLVGHDDLIKWATAEDDEEPIDGSDGDEEKTAENPDDALEEDDEEDDEDFARTMNDPSVVVLEALQDLAIGQKDLADQLRVGIARRRAVADAASRRLSVSRATKDEL